MKVALIGATGMAGSRILNELVERGHHVTAIARHTEKLKQSEKITPVSLDINDHTTLQHTLKNHDAVISSVQFTNLNINGLIQDVQNSGVKRYLIVGGGGSLTLPGQNIRLIDSPDFPPEYKVESEAGCRFLDALKQQEQLDWTFVCPSLLFEPGERTGKFRLGKDELLSDENGSHISAEDFAIAFVDELEQGQFIQQRMTVGY